MDGFRSDSLTMASICKEQYPDRASEMASLTTDQVEKLFCDLCSKELDARTGFKIQFRVKKRSFFAQMPEQHHRVSTVADDSAPMIYRALAIV